MGGEIVESANRRYYLQDKFTIEYDVDQYRALAKRARDSRIATDYRTAVERYTGHFMTGISGTWLEDARAALQAEHLALLHAAAEAARDEGDLDATTALYQRMTEHEPYSELAWEGLADLLGGARRAGPGGRGARALRAPHDRSLSPFGGPGCTRRADRSPAAGRRPLGGPACTSST